MSTLATAIDAMIAVGKAAMTSGDPTHGAFYGGIVWSNQQPFDDAKAASTPYIHVYPMSGTTSHKSLGYSIRTRMPRIRFDLFSDSRNDVELLFEAFTAALIADFDYANGNGTPGQMYLRHTGKIKVLTIGEIQAATWEKRGLIFRRIADTVIEIAD